MSHPDDLCRVSHQAFQFPANLQGGQCRANLPVLNPLLRPKGNFRELRLAGLVETLAPQAERLCRPTHCQTTKLLQIDRLQLDPTEFDRVTNQCQQLLTLQIPHLRRGRTDLPGDGLQEFFLWHREQTNQLPLHSRQLGMNLQRKAEPENLTPQPQTLETQYLHDQLPQVVNRRPKAQC
jgi:hypothetical protein